MNDAMRIVRNTDDMIAHNSTPATPNAILSLSAIATGALIVTGILAAFS